MWILLTAAVFLSSCTTLSSDSAPAAANRQEIVGLIDMAYEYVEQEWGKPDYDLPKTNGRTVKFEGVKTVDTDLETGGSVVKLCRVKLDINQEGLIENWDYEDCVYADPQAAVTQDPGEPVEDDSVDLGQKPIDIDEDDMDPSWNELDPKDADEPTE